jgi:hypothetical protein
LRRRKEIKEGLAGTQMSTFLIYSYTLHPKAWNNKKRQVFWLVLSQRLPNHLLISGN